MPEPRSAGGRLVGAGGAPTGILDLGNSILVNSAYLAPPYEVRAIGPADLYTRLTSAASFVEFVQRRIDPAGLRLSFAELDEVTVPAFAGTVSGRYLRPDLSAAGEWAVRKT